MTQRFKDVKSPTEKRVLTFDFSADLATGEALAAPIAVTFETEFGIDASPSSMANGSAALDSTATQVLVPVKGGTAGVDYRVTVTVATTNAAKAPALAGILSVRT